MPLTRSEMMGRIKHAGTKPEIRVAAALRKAGKAYRKNVRGLPGTPDFANKTGRWAIFVHGCYWHRHPNCTRASTPASNIEFWLQKFEQNIARDKRVLELLEARGIHTLVIWECGTKSDMDLGVKLETFFNLVAANNETR